MADATNVKVAVRVRPFNSREMNFEKSCVLEMRENQTMVRGKFTKDGSPKKFSFDHSLWSHTADDAHFVSQEQVYEALGRDVLENSLEGYNACIFAYGQTGSGKTYTMMGTPKDEGVIPRLCRELFSRTTGTPREGVRHKIEVSYMEIYNEKVKDLLAVKGDAGHTLKVREHKAMGPYVQGLLKLAVTSFEDVSVLMDQGNSMRTTAKTKMNDTSSRSHAIFTLFVTEQWYDKATKQTGEKVSRLSLVDLAGSERVIKTGATGARLKEGANINKSLHTLGLVIKALADAGAKRDKFVPFRDSTLTWLLKDNLGGNSKTVMIAAVSPSIDNLDETISTLRYANSAKQIVNRAFVNEDPNAKMIRELREELERLRSQVGGAPGEGAADSEELEKIRAQLAETEHLLEANSKSWEDKLKESQRVMDEHKKLLSDHGASVTGSKGALSLESRLPHLVTIASGLDFGIHIYTLKEGMTRFGTVNDEQPQDVVLEGAGIEPEHCIIEHAVTMDEETNQLKEVVQLHPIGDCYVNGEELEDSVELNQGDQVQFGDEHVLRFNHPTQALRMKQAGLAAPGPKAKAIVGMAGAAAPLFVSKRDAAVAEEVKAQMQAELDAEKEKQREEQKRLEAVAAEHEAEIKRQREESEKAEAGRLEAEKVKRLKEEENEKLRRQVEEMQARLAAEAAAREAEEQRVAEERQKKVTKAAELQAKHDEARAHEEALRQAQQEEELRKMAELNALLEAEKRDREELAELRRQQQEDERKAHEAILQEERARLQREIEEERQAAEQIRLEAEERAREAQRQRDAAAVERAEAEELARQHELELERNRQEQERIRAHQMKIATIDEARKKAEERKAELEALKAAQLEKARAGFSSLSVDKSYLAGGGENAAANPFAKPPSVVDSHGEELRRQRELFRQRQQLPEVQNAGKPNAQDEKIRLFEAAKAKYMAKQVVRDVVDGGDAAETNPFLQGGAAAQPGAAVSDPGPLSPNELTKYNAVVPDEVVPEVQTPETYFAELEREKKKDMAARGDDGFEGESMEWLTHQWDLLAQQEWFRGFCSRKDAESELRKMPSGAFVVRVSESKPGRYAISVLQGGVVQHLLVIPSYAGNDPNAPGGTRYRLGETSRILFNTVPKLCAYYIARPYHRLFRLRGHVKAEQQAGGFGASGVADE
mmetsp:Transcript_16675/g.49035  ORF Transcript_16675/g.49035 Transcript_16675/m.49035 type:complete len:1171 (+) Transcript_16675:59-3571(+)